MNERLGIEREATSYALEAIKPGCDFYQAFGDPVMFSYALAPVLVNSVLVPEAAQGVQEHERLVNGSIPELGIGHVIGRLTDTIDLLWGIVFADEESQKASHALFELHRTVGGKMPDGSAYHAWQKETWSQTWFVQVRAFMEVYGELRGFENEDSRLAIYRGFVALGRHFRVGGMPESLEGFDERWEELVASTLTDSDSARFLVSQTTHRLVKPNGYSWLPTPIWAAMTLPFRRVARIGLLMVLPEHLDANLGIRRSWFDQAERNFHRSLWKLIPKSLSSGFGPAYFSRRRSRQRPVWRARYSAKSLDERREAHKQRMRSELI